MKKIAIILAALFVLALPQPARAVLYYTVLPPYSCSIPGFNLVKQQGTYFFTGSVYVPIPGYTYAVSPLVFTPGLPGDLAVTLTLQPPATSVPQRLLVVPPLGVNYSFLSTVPVRSLTVYIANTVNTSRTLISCRPTGAPQ